MTVIVNDGQSEATFTTTVSITQQLIVPVQPNINEITNDLRPIYNAATNPEQETPRNTGAIAIIGDQTASNPNFLLPFRAGEPYTVTDSAASLGSVISRFGDGLNQRNVPSLEALISPSGDPACNGQTELVCYINQTNSTIVVIGVGIQDAINMTDASTLDNRLNQAIQQAIAANSIPVLLTLYPSEEATMQAGIDTVNAAIIRAGDVNNVPVINVWRAVNDIPGGVVGSTPSTDPQGAGYLTFPPSAGFNAMNYYTLATLNDIVNAVFD